MRSETLSVPGERSAAGAARAALRALLCAALVVPFTGPAGADDRASQDTPGSTASPAAPAPASAANGDDLLPVLPTGISDFDFEITATYAYTWSMADGVRVIECQGAFTARMGQNRLSARDAVIWFKRAQWNERPYYEFEIFLWQDAEVLQPGGTIESGAALLVSLRTFGRLLLNADAWSPAPDTDSELFRQGLKARGLLDEAPPRPPEDARSPIQISPSAETVRRMKARKPPKSVSFSADKLTHQPYREDRSVVVAIGNVMLSQGSPATPGEYMELRADSAVVFRKPDQPGVSIPGILQGKESARSSTTQPSTLPAALEPTLTGDEKTPRSQAGEWVSAVYLEGDVVLTRGQRMIRAARLYYDFETDRALILDVVARALEESRGLPIYVRAETVRQLSIDQYEATDAQVTTSEFYTPHASMGAGRVILTDRTPRNERGEIIGVMAGSYKAYNTTLNLEGVPLAWWPASSGDFSADRMAFRSAKFGYHSDFGGTFETRWYLFNLLGLETPPGFDASLKLDYFTDRGPGVGIDADYVRDNYYGLFRGYYIHDDGEDDLGGELRDGPPDHENRGRVLLRHRQYLPEDWELTLEGAYVSDDNYLESFERNEFENGKDQETLLYLLKRRDNWQFSALANARVNDFFTQTEHLPDVSLSLVGEPMARVATFFHESRAGIVRYEPDERRWRNGQNRRDNTGATGAVMRADAREEVEFPLRMLGPLQLTPYLMVRGTAWDDMPRGQSGDQRGFGSYGLRGNMILSRVYENVESELFDLHRLRHVIKPDFTIWNAHANQSPDGLTPFDPGVETIDDFGGGTIGFRQRWQTQRGGPGHWKTVDWITWDVEAGFFTDKRAAHRTHGDFIMSRPEESISSNFISNYFAYRISDSTVLIHDGVYDLNRDQVGTTNVTLAVEREPRLAYFVGWRYIHDTDSNLFGFGANYKLNEKHTVGFREFYDIDEGRNHSTELIYIRRWPRWYTAVALDIDRTLDDVGIHFSLWPEGAPQLALGSRRYTGMTEGVGLRPR